MRRVRQHLVVAVAIADDDAVECHSATTILDSSVIDCTTTHRHRCDANRDSSSRVVVLWHCIEWPIVVVRFDVSDASLCVLDRSMLGLVAVLSAGRDRRVMARVRAQVQVQVQVQAWLRSLVGRSAAVAVGIFVLRQQRTVDRIAA